MGIRILLWVMLGLGLTSSLGALQHGNDPTYSMLFALLFAIIITIAGKRTGE